MRKEPANKGAYAFIDGQNLFYAAREAFGYAYPNYDPKLLAQKICHNNGWTLLQTYFYTGVPSQTASPFWSHFWNAKLAAMGTRGVRTFHRQLRYRNQIVKLSDGTQTTIPVGREKGVDVRLALDVIRTARLSLYDVALIFSQDQDLSELADEIKETSKRESRWIQVASAFPVGPTSRNSRGINGTDWIQIDRATYDACIDPADYRPKRRST